jgi:hypothetical protein
LNVIYAPVWSPTNGVETNTSAVSLRSMFLRGEKREKLFPNAVGQRPDGGEKAELPPNSVEKTSFFRYFHLFLNELSFMFVGIVIKK